jgi:hypothetical protein
MLRKKTAAIAIRIAHMTSRFPRALSRPQRLAAVVKVSRFLSEGRTTPQPSHRSRSCQDASSSRPLAVDFATHLRRIYRSEVFRQYGTVIRTEAQLEVKRP